jgi:hypothetical protein
VYRWVEEKPKGGMKLPPLRKGELEVPEDRWTVVSDPIAHAEGRGSFVCDAPPGFGKSDLLKKVRQVIPDAMVLAPTHVAARRHPGAITVHAFIHRFVFLKRLQGHSPHG